MENDLNKLSQWIEAASTQADAAALLEWAQTTIGRIELGELMLGILPIDQARLVPVALHKALGLGLGEAGIVLADWLVRTPIGEPDIRAAEQASLDAIALGASAACVPLMRYRWFYRRNECSADEARQAFTLLLQWQTQHPDDSVLLYLLGLVTCHGFGTTADPAKSAEILKQAAILGNADAAFELHIYHVNGIGVAADEGKAAAYLLQAGEAGQLRAMYNLGALHATGRLFPQDMGLAVKWYTKAAEAGHAKAAGTLAKMYGDGLGVERDPALAQKFREMAGG